MHYLLRSTVMMTCLVVMASLAHAGLPLPPPPPGLPAPPRLFAPAPPDVRVVLPGAPAPGKPHKKHKKKHKKADSDRGRQQGLFQSGSGKH